MSDHGQGLRAFSWRVDFDVDPAAARDIESRLDPDLDRITGSAGSVILRDERVWYRGGVNRTSEPRCMFSSIGWRAA